MNDYDVIVAGGGIGGFSAALGAARAGARTLLIEKYGFLGGVATASNVLAFCGLYQSGTEQPVPASTGANDILFAELKRLGMSITPSRNPNTGNWIVLLEPERLKLAMDNCLHEAGVDTLLHARVIGAETTNGTLERVTLAAHEGDIHCSAKGFVDATGDAHIARYVEEASNASAPAGALQPYSSPIRVGGLPEDVVIDRPALIAALAAYSETGPFPVHRKKGGFFARIPGSTDIWWMIIDYPCERANSAELTAAERYTRAAAQDYVKVLRSIQPETANACLVQTGPQVGIRESWHPQTIDKVVAEDLLAGRQRNDAIARAAWPMEDHSIIGNPVFTRIGGDGFAHIPFGAIRSSHADNLVFAGRTLGADPLAFASVRVMGTAFATGFAAGVAAANTNASQQEIASKIIAYGGLI